VVPAEVITDRAPTYPRVVDEMWPAVWHHTERYSNNRVEADRAQLKQRLHRRGRHLDRDHPMTDTIDAIAERGHGAYRATHHPHRATSPATVSGVWVVVSRECAVSRHSR
jgi:transposase-like protein